MPESSVLPWLSFGLALLVAILGGATQLGTLAYVIGKMSATSAVLTKGMEDVRAEFGVFRVEVNEKLERLNQGIIATTIQDIRIEGRLQALERGDSDG